MKYHDKTDIDRRYWTIGQVARMLGVNTSKVRFWLSEFGIDKNIHRGKAHDRQRLFTATDVEMIQEIHRLREKELYTLPGVKRKLMQKAEQVEVSNMLRVGCIVLCLLVMGCRPYFNQANVVKAEKGKHSQIGR